MASSSILDSLSAAKLADLKKKVGELLQSCDGHRMDLSRFKKEYKDVYRKTFERQYGSLKSNKLKDVMAELDDVITLEENENGFTIVLKVVRGESSHSPVNKELGSPGKCTGKLDSRSDQQVDACPQAPSSPSVASPSGVKTLPVSNLASPAALPISVTPVPVDAKTSKEGNSLVSSHEKISDRKMLKAQRRSKKASGTGAKEANVGGVTSPVALGDQDVPVLVQESLQNSAKVKNIKPADNFETTKENAATIGSPQTPLLSPSAVHHLVSNPLPLSPPPSVQTTGFGPQVTGAGRLAQAGPSLREIMHQQEQEQRLAKEGLLPSPVGYEKLLKEMQETPSPVRRSPVKSSPDLKDARVREIGIPGPFERSFDHAQQIMSTVEKTKPSKQVTLREVNRAAEEIITSMSEEGEFVSLEKVKAKLCRQFGRPSLNALGFKRDKDIPALHDLTQLQNKVSLFVHAYVMSSSIATLYELGQSLADLGSKQDFEDLKLGSLLQQPVVYDMFKAPSSLPSLPRITTIQILKHLEKYMTKEDLWRTKVDLTKFLEYLCEEYNLETPYELGVRIQSVGLAISVIKTAKRCESERWKAARKQVSDDMDEEIQRHLRKIKKDLLGQEHSDLRSCVKKVLDASPVDAIKEIFDCCLELFEGNRQKAITKFFTSVIEDVLGRRLFQLALYMSCKRLIGDALEQLVEDEVEKQVASNMKDIRETETRPLPPSEGVIVEEVKAWLANADNIDLARLATIEENVVSKFPDFNHFEEFGYGSFLRFLTSPRHKELLVTIEQVGGMASARSGGMGTKIGHQVSLDSVLGFISQCGTQTSPGIIEQNLCTYYGIKKVTDLGFGSCPNLLKKAEEHKKKMARLNTPSVVYEAALVCHEPSTKDSGNSTLEAHSGGVLGYMSKEDAIAAIESTPLLEDVARWTHWHEVFGGEVSRLGDLKSFLENEGILMNAGKSSPGTHGSLVVMETSPGVLLRVTTKTSPEIFKECACRGDAVGAAGHLVSMVMMNSGVANTPVALLANHVQSSLASMAAQDGCDCRANFVLECLVHMPRKLAQAVGTKVFFEPLKKFVGSTEAPSLLLSSCTTHLQRSQLHQLGFALGISQWIEDYKTRVSSSQGKDLELKLGVDQNELQKRPIAVVRPVPFANKQIEQLEESVTTAEDDVASPGSEESVTDDDVKEEAIISDSENDQEEQLTPFTPSTKQQDECRAVIEQIRREDFGIGLELGEEESKLVQRQREREGRGLHRLSTELYSRDTHFVLELVQNADDNSYPEESSSAGSPSLVFVLERDKIVVLNNEFGFMEKNIRALCDVGRSTKGAHRYGYIGQKGIGFKSVFRVSDCPEVHSKGYHIQFDAKSGPIGYILPQWIEERCEEEEGSEDGQEGIQGDNPKPKREVDPVISEYDRWATRIVLPLKEEHQGLEKTSLAARFRDVHPSLLLFLHRLRSISIHDKVNNIQRDMIRKDLGDNIMEVSHTNGTDRWLVIKKELDASNMKEDVAMTELALAFPLFSNLDQDGNFGRRHQKLPQQNVFAYLPLRSYGFRFIIQGDFEVPSSREDVDSDKSWNQWLREEIPQLFIDALSVFMEHPSFSGLSSLASYFQFVPLEEEILDFFTPVARHILTLLQGKPCIPVKMAEQETSGYDWDLPCKAIFCQDTSTQELIIPTLLEEHLGLRYLHPDIAPALNPTLRCRLGIETLSSKHLLEIGKAEVKKFTEEITAAAVSDGVDRRPDVAKIGWLARWLQCMYKCLEEERNSSQDILDLIGSLSVIPLTDGTFVNLNGDSIFMPLSMKKSSEGPVPKKKKSSSTAKSHEETYFNVLERDLSTVHPALLSSLDDIGRSQVEQLLRRLGVKSWSSRDLINSHIIPTLKSDKWKGKSSEVLRSYVVYILEQRLNDPSVCDMDELRSCVQILTNKGPLNPTETPVHFTPKYGNAIDLARELPSISWTLVDESYLDSCTGSKARGADWKAFLADLGVQNFLAIKKKQVKLHRSNMAQSPWASYERIWQTTPDGLYVIDDWSCEEFEEFLEKMVASDATHQVACNESKVLSQCIDERWDNEYSQYADVSVHVKDSNGHMHILGDTRSSFYLNLVFKPWLSATGVTTSLFIARDLFIRSEFVYGLLEDHVKYTAADLKNSAFISILRIRESISVDDMISEMKKWSTTQSGKSVEGRQSKEFTTSLAHMSEVYSFLLERMSQSEEERKKISEAFLKNALIFVPRRYPESSSSKQIHMAHRLPGSFYLLKDVCWRDPTDVGSKLLKDHGKITTGHLLQGYYHSCSRTSGQQSLAAFFVDQLNVHETPKVDEYIEMASTVAEVAGFPTPSSLSDMLKIFSVLGRKCIAVDHNDSIRVENEINPNMAAFLKQSLEGEERSIFPSFGKWVSLSDKPLLPDDKSLLKIFQNLKEKDIPEGEGKMEKKKGVYFLDLGDLFQQQKQRSRSDQRKQERGREEMKQNVSLFLKICEVKTLSECITKEFIPRGVVQYQCVPLQKCFHQLMPPVQRFLHSKNPAVYDELSRQGFSQKLLKMQFASVGSLETVYSLSTHPDIVIPIEEKSGVETVGSMFCLYVVQNCLESADVLNAEIIKLMLGEKKQGSSELHNFLFAIRGYNGSDLELFLEEIQGLEPLPDGEELWCVPPPEEPEVVEVEEEAPLEVTSTLNTDMPLPYSAGDDGLHSWPPKSAAQFDKTRKREGEPSDDNTLKMWPPPAPPDSMKKSQEEEEQRQGRLTQRDADVERPKGSEVRGRESDEKVGVTHQQYHPQLQPEVFPREPAEKIVHQTNEQKDPDSTIVEGVIQAELPKDYISHENENTIRSEAHMNPQPSQISAPGDVAMVIDHGCQARQIPPSQSNLWFDGGTQDIDFEDLAVNGDLEILNKVPPDENSNREDIGRWGEQCVFEFLLNQAKFPPPGMEVEIVWMNEKGNTTHPYDLEIRQRPAGEQDEVHSKMTVITYVEVKTTSSNQKEIFEISVPELQFALEKQKAFHLYRVFNAGNPSCLRIRRLQNLASQLGRKNVKLCMVI